MGKVNCGILDGFMGKVGTVVGGFWKGIPVMRAYVRNGRDANSEAQRLQRLRFKATSQLSSVFLDATIIGLRKAAVANRMTESNVFFALNADKVTASGLDTLSVDYTGIVVAAGPLPQVGFDVPGFDTPQQVDVDFKANLECKYANADDDVYVFVYCHDADSGVLSAPVKRSEGTVSVKVPADWNGLKVHVWGFAMGTKESLRAGQASDSAYIGTGNIG